MNLTAIAIIAIICWTIIKLTGKDKKEVKPANQAQAQPDNAELQQKLIEMNKRIAVLEAIVTDEKYALKREFDNLSRTKAA